MAIFSFFARFFVFSGFFVARKTIVDIFCCFVSFVVENHNFSPKTCVPPLSYVNITELLNS